jgi:hypothetical protein
VIVVMNFQVIEKARNFLTNWATVTFWRTLFHGVSNNKENLIVITWLSLIIFNMLYDTAFSVFYLIICARAM